MIILNLYKQGVRAVEIRQLKYFVKTCSVGSFAQAAEQCYISSQGLCMAIGRLEDELSQKLFYRSAKGISLTPAGEYLLPRAVEILDRVAECEGHFAGAGSEKQSLPVAFSRGTIEEFAGPCLSKFAAEHPGVSLDVVEGTDLSCDEAVEKNEAAFGLTVGPVDGGKLDAILLRTLDHAFLCHESHPLAGREEIRPEDLRGVPLAMTNPSTRSYPQLREACRAFGFEPEVRTFVDNPLLIFYLVQTGQMCGITAYNLGKRQNTPGVRVIPFAPGTMDWSVYMISRRNAALSGPARELQDEFLSRAAALRRA